MQQVTPDVVLLEKAQSFLDALLSSFQEGKEPSNSLLPKWAALEETIQIHHSGLQEGTIEELNGYLSIIDTIASGFILVEDHSQVFFDELASDLTKIINENMRDLAIDDDQPLNFHTPSYVKPSFDWLLSNLHNPYPSKEVRRHICQRTGAKLRAVDAWFTDARKRIGWNKLRKTRYKNRQDDIVRAATKSFLCAQDTATFIGSKNSHHAEFIAIQQRALHHYRQLFGETHLFETGADSVELAVYEERSSRSCTSRTKKRMTSYPSPLPSPDRSPSPAPSSDNCSPRPDFSELCVGLDISRPFFDQFAEPVEQVSYLPSPAPSTTSLKSSHDDDNTLSAPTSLIGKRKRASDDTGEQAPTKRLHSSSLNLTQPTSSINLRPAEILSSQSSSDQDLICGIPKPVRTSSIDNSVFDIEVPRINFFSQPCLTSENTGVIENNGQLELDFANAGTLTTPDVSTLRYDTVPNECISQLGFGFKDPLDEFLGVEILPFVNPTSMLYPTAIEAGLLGGEENTMQSHHQLDFSFLFTSPTPITPLQTQDCNTQMLLHDDVKLKRIEHLRKELQLLEAEV